MNYDLLIKKPLSMITEEEMQFINDQLALTSKVGEIQLLLSNNQREMISDLFKVIKTIEHQRGDVHFTDVTNHYKHISFLPTALALLESYNYIILEGRFVETTVLGRKEYERLITSKYPAILLRQSFGHFKF